LGITLAFSFGLNPAVFSFHFFFPSSLSLSQKHFLSLISVNPEETENTSREGGNIGFPILSLCTPLFTVIMSL